MLPPVGIICDRARNKRNETRKVLFGNVWILCPHTPIFVPVPIFDFPSPIRHLFRNCVLYVHEMHLMCGVYLQFKTHKKENVNKRAVVECYRVPRYARR